MTRLFYTILYSAMAALVIAQWNRHDSGELLDLVGARHANAQSPDPSLPGAFDPAASGGMNNPSGFNNMNPANPAAQLMNSNAQQSPSNQIFTKDASRPAAWPSKPAIYWGAPPKQTAQPIPGADGLPGVSLTQYQEALDPSKPAAAAPVDPNVPIGLQYPNPNPPYPTTSNYSNPAAAPSYPSTGMPSAPPYAGAPAGYPPPANVPPSNAPAGYPPPANYPPGTPPAAYPTTTGGPPGNAPVGPPPTANTPLSSAPVGYPPAAIASPGNAPIDYPLPANAPPANAPPTNAPPTNAPAASTPVGSVPPGNTPPGSVPPGNPPTAATGQPPAANVDYGKRLPGTRIIARVGTEFVLEADVMGYVNDMINRNKDRIPKEQLEKVREELMKQRLNELIQTKVVLCELRGRIPKEGYKKFSEKLGQNFDEEEVPKAMARTGAKSRFDLDEQMRVFGGSLDREKAAYVERQMAMGWIHEQSKSDKEVTHEQMLEYYYKHIKEYEFQSKVRWEQLQVRFKTSAANAKAQAMAPLEWDPKTGQMRLKSDPSKIAAWRTIAEAGNRIIAGEPFADVAKAVSDGPTASKGGMHDWTNQGSLSSEEVDRTLFTYPIGQLSPIIEDERGFQIVRVVERKMAGREPFTEVQADIKKNIKAERSAEAMRKYVSGLKDRVSVWTMFDGTQMEELEPVRSKDDTTPANSPSGSTGKEAPWMRGQTQQTLMPAPASGKTPEPA